MSKEAFHHALKVQDNLCIGCTHCMQVCPTQAVRVVNGKAEISANKCVDCGECMRACPVDAIVVEHDDFAEIFDYKYRVALVPAVLIGQFSRNIPEQQIYSVLYEIGFTHIYEVEQPIDYLIKEINQQLLESDISKPAISTFCPAIVRLIQVKFPALVENILRLKPPSDISALFFKKQLIDKGLKPEEIGMFYITPCAAKIASIKSPVGEVASPVDGVINMDFIYNKILSAINNKEDETCVLPPEKNSSARGIQWSLTNGELNNVLGTCFAIDEIHNVIEFLEKVESEEITGIDFLELRACDGSCAGGVLTTENRFITIERMKHRAEKYEDKTKDVNMAEVQEFIKYNEFLKENIKISEIEARSMLTLDEDMGKAMEKMQKAQKIQKVLPNIDCGACGTPSCAILAEDIVQEKAKISQCIFYQHKLVKNKRLSIEDADKNLKKVWGKDKFS